MKSFKVVAALVGAALLVSTAAAPQAVRIAAISRAGEAGIDLGVRSASWAGLARFVLEDITVRPRSAASWTAAAPRAYASFGDPIEVPRIDITLTDSGASLGGSRHALNSLHMEIDEVHARWAAQQPSSTGAGSYVIDVSLTRPSRAAGWTLSGTVIAKDIQVPFDLLVMKAVAHVDAKATLQGASRPDKPDVLSLAGTKLEVDAFGSRRESALGGDLDLGGDGLGPYLLDAEMDLGRVSCANLNKALTGELAVVMKVHHELGNAGGRDLSVRVDRGCRLEF